MPLIDLGTPAPPPRSWLDGLPRRIALTLPELRFVARHAGDAPLPFDVSDPAAAPALDGRLGQSRRSVDDAAYADALGALRDPAVSLSRRGLLVGHGDEAVVDEGLVGAVGLLATPSIALDVDISVGTTQARSWHRHDGRAVATLSTVAGIVFELAWFGASAWPGEIGRIAVVPEDVVLTGSEVPPHVELPYELADAAGEALRNARADLVPVLVERHHEQVTDAQGNPVPAGDVRALLNALAAESRGRLRALVADVSTGEAVDVGVVSWTLLADGWHSLTPRQVGDALHVVVRRVEASDLAGELAPVFATVLTEAVA